MPHRARAIADAGDREAMFALAMMRIAGRGGPLDRQEAVKLLASAAKLGEPKAAYNLALLYQGSNQPIKAVHHWTRYLKLDPNSHWSTIARQELAKLRRTTVLPGSRG